VEAPPQLQFDEPPQEHFEQQELPLAPFSDMMPRVGFS
jgi:hypothetical protein